MSNAISDMVSYMNEDFIKKIESFIKCPRCKQNLKYYKRKILTNSKCKYKGVCDHCLNEYLYHKTSKPGIDKKGTSKDVSPKLYNKEKIKLWLSKVIDLLENNVILLKAANLSKYARHKEKSSSKIRYRKNEDDFKIMHEPQVDQMFKATDDTLTITKEKKDQTKKQKLGIRYYDDASYSGKYINFKEKKVKSYDDIAAPFGVSDDDRTISSVDSRDTRTTLLQHKLEILKKDIRDEKELPVRNQYDYQSYKKHKPTDIDEVLEKGFSKKLSADISKPILDFKKDKKESVSSLAEDLKSEIREGTKSKSSLAYKKRSLSAEPTKSKADLKEESQEQNFSYFFPREEHVKKTIRRHKSSSEIIKEVMEMLSTRAELEKIKKEKERKRKIEEEERKNQARLEKIARLAEKKKEMELQAQEIKTEIDANIKTETDSNEIKLKVGHKVKDTDEKSSGKSKSTKSALKPKVSKPDSSMAQKKDELKKEKEDRSAAEKERKLKEKEEREERLRLEKERKMKEKAEKEERLKMERENKLKEKEEKERLKKEKQEQVQKEKDERRKQKEEQEKASKAKDNKTEPNSNIDPAKLLAERDKQREEEMKLKQKQDEESKQMRELADKKLKEEAFAKMAGTKQDNVSHDDKKEKSEPPKPKPQEEPNVKELNISKVRLRKQSPDDLILQLVKIRQAEEKKSKTRPKRLSELNVSACTIKAHQYHKLRRGINCMICEDSELELDVDNILYNERRETEKKIIIGEKILKSKAPCIEKPKENNIFEPLLFKSNFHEDASVTILGDSDKSLERKPPAPATNKHVRKHLQYI